MRRPDAEARHQAARPGELADNPPGAPADPRGICRVLAVLAVVVLAVAAVDPATAAPPPVTRICAQYWHTAVRGAYVVRNDFFGAQDPAECVTIRHGGANFRVSTSRAAGDGSKVQAYPNIFLGCEYGVCSPHSRLPMRASRLVRPVTSWRIRDRATGIWDAACDLWFTRHKETTGKADGAELMIWLGARAVAYSSRRVVRIDGQSWYYASWHTRHDGGAWQYIQFRRVMPTERETNLRLAPFLRFAERHRAMSRRWWLESVEAGFEIWRGGTGLATRSFAVSLGRRHRFPISVPPDQQAGSS
jgi:hypothetical protein